VESIIGYLNDKCKTKCGFSDLNVLSGIRDDIMESFFLSETLKYLYLVLDQGNFNISSNHKDGCFKFY
jgi:ER degradation enhancer, mannosidase alpha-like 1